jgi:hypothetical protein
MIKNWKLFKESVDSESKIHELCKKYNILNYTINDDFSIDVDDDVNISDKKLDKIPLRFRNVSGCFSCNNNKLKDLKGAPSSVGGGFSCYDNKLTDLKGAPSSVGGYFWCNNNNLTDLRGSPSSVGGYFSCYNNNLTDLRGAPSSVGDFSCSNNKLTDLKGAPSSVGGYFWCDDNKIWTFYGLSENFSTSSFECEGNPIYKIWELFQSSKDIEFFNECDIIREPETPDDLPIVIIERLNFFLETIGKHTVEGVDGYINI